MHTVQQSRLQQIARQNRGRLVLPRLLNGLSSTLQRPIPSESLLDLTRSDALRTDAITRYKAGLNQEQPFYHLVLPKGGFALLQEELTAVGNALAGVPAYLAFTKEFEDCGAVQVDASEVLDRVADLLAFDGDAFLLYSQATDGLLIDLVPDDPDQTYELAVWGPTWVGLCRSASRDLLNAALNVRGID